MQSVLIVVARNKSVIPYIMWGVSGFPMGLGQITSIHILRVHLEGKLDSYIVRIRWIARGFIETNRIILHYNTLATETKEHVQS